MKMRGSPSAGGRGGGGSSEDSAGGSESARGGAPTGEAGISAGEGAGAPSEDGGFTISDPSEDCEADSSVSVTPSTPNPRLGTAPSSGQACDSTFEPNDAAGIACRLALAKQVETQLSPPSDATDNFVFHAEAGVTYTVMTSAVGCQGTSSLDTLGVVAKSLATAGTTTLGNRGTYLGKTASFEVTSNTTSDVLVTVTSGNSCQYGLQVVPSTAQGLEHSAGAEPNDTRSTAAPIELATVVASELAEPDDVIDHFTFPVQAGLVYSLRVSAERCSGRSSLDSLTVRGWSNHATVQNVDSLAYFGKARDVEFTTTTSGDQVLSFETNQSCEYDFYVVPSTVCGLVHDKHSYEPNNTPSTATPIAIGRSITSEIRPPQDTVDHYAFAVEPLTPYSLSIAATNCHGSSSLASLVASLYSGRSNILLNASREVFFGAARLTIPFTTGSARQELLAIDRSQPCGYDFVITKD